MTSRPLIAEQPPPGHRVCSRRGSRRSEGTESTESTPECKKSSNGKSGQTQARPEGRGERWFSARFCLLSIEAFSQGARFSADGVKLPSRAAEGLQPPAWVRPHLLPLPSAYALKLASRRIVFILFLQPQLLPDSFQSVTPQLTIQAAPAHPGPQPAASFRNSLPGPWPRARPGSQVVVWMLCPPSVT